MPISFFELNRQNQDLKSELSIAIQSVIEKGQFIKGKEIELFENQLAAYLRVKHVIACGNGTDALQIALMSLQLKPGDEVIVPAFTYIASIEVIVLLGLTPVLADIEPDTFNISIESLKNCIGPKTKAIIPVHLFGQCANMEAILEIANQYHLAVIEDNAQSIGAICKFSSEETAFAGCMGDIGTTSFFPSKNLSCFGDGGALFTNNDELAKKIRMIANHGQSVQYKHDYIGVNSRLDTLQAAILKIKLSHLPSFESNRISNANLYLTLLNNLEGIELPYKAGFSTHVYNQFTIRIKNGKRDALKAQLALNGIPSMVYYASMVHEQNAYQNKCITRTGLPNANMACKEVLSLPIYPELQKEEIETICNTLISLLA
jgi:UDP-2-acetamido-2-deoxy-ribo-hexuluronate aminotransferase